MKNRGYVTGALAVISLAIGGCAADTGTPSEPSEPTAPSATTTAAAAPASPPAATGATSDSLHAPSAFADRGQLVGTVLASSATTKATGVSVWGTYKIKGKVTTLGFDKDGNIKSELSLALIPGTRDIAISAPASGSILLHEDGTIFSNTFIVDKQGLSAMHSDFDANGKDAAYGWLKWVLTYVSCAAAGFEAGLNPIADAACAAGAIDLMTE
jgi:hypothetical protein